MQSLLRGLSNPEDVSLLGSSTAAVSQTHLEQNSLLSVMLY